MAKKNRTSGVRFSEETFERINKHAQQIGYSSNQFIEEAVVSVLDMIEHKARRVVPKIVRLAEEAADYYATPQPLKSVKKTAKPK